MAAGMVTIVVIAPSPLYQQALFAGPRDTLLLSYPIIDPERYLACCAERAREAAHYQDAAHG